MTFRIRPRHKSPISAARAWARNERGIAATEFALILPFLLLILMGVIELTNAMLAERKLLNSVQSAVDLIGQRGSITTAELNEIFAAARLTVSPLDTAVFSLGVASVRYNDTTGDPVLDWTGSDNGGSVANPTVKAEGRGEAGASIVIVTGNYIYTPLIPLIIPVNIILTETSYMRPRIVDWIEKL